ncbi:MAG: bifunctional (p)ppGpp synthetase/guanosine-3',5'-bis(diphosphate) 3'-pyrophosphohydrolase [Oscillospiraceae bacterium]|nr:bifunctional (p)ppGpp synthetase/guanosine-3',5'-bis(diphosphate) 3'-pyrophosphohydrolase [Oscillospiraceae bacterium]
MTSDNTDKYDMTEASADSGDKHSDITELMAMLAATGYNYDFEKISKAYNFAKICHCGQYRKSGEEYICHPVAVAELVASLELDTDSICAALLHDTIEDCPDKVTPEKIREEFGEDVYILVDGLTKLVSIQYADKAEQQVENLRKMFLAMSKDVRVIFIKLCDRLHNMRTLSSHREDKQRLIALETMHVYAPLAHRLGMQKIKSELEVLGMQYLDPIGYEEVKRDIDRKYGANKNFLDHAQEIITENLKAQNIKFAIEGRVKSIYSIYKKMYTQNKDFNEIYDFYAIRILVDTEMECYTVLGMIHETFNSIPGRFKDYISTPKPNGYRSLHTTVIGRDGIPFEVQIRTWEMHAIAEYGIAAHWKYKMGSAGSRDSLDKKLEWIRTLLETERDETDPDEFLRPLKIDLFEDETFVFTPKGDVVNLPSGANGIDFAYAIHSAIGNKMVGVKINGMIAPIDTPLQTGQIVEVLTSAASKGPSRDWIKLVKTGEARNKIRQWFKKERRAENIAIAKAEIDRELAHAPRNITEDQKQELIISFSKRYGLANIDDFYNSLGYGGISLQKITERIRDELSKLASPAVADAPFANISDTSHPPVKPSGERVFIEGMDGFQIKYAKCCNPLPGDRIVGFMTRGFGISIHKYDCHNTIAGLKNPETKDRWFNAEWILKTGETDSGFDAILNIIANNTVTILADISGALADMHVNVLSINSRARSDGVITLSLCIRTKNTEHFQSIISRVKKIKDIIEVARG